MGAKVKGRVGSSLRMSGEAVGEQGVRAAQRGADVRGKMLAQHEGHSKLKE